MNRRILTGVFAVFMLSIMSTGNAFAMTFDVDNGGALPDLVDITFTISAIGEQCDINDVDVRLAIAHTWVGDLDITLESPLNTIVTLVDQPGNPPAGFGSAADNFPDVILDDSAIKPIEITDGGVHAYVIGDSYTPNGALSAFNGEDPNGVWNLRVTDVQQFDAGALFKAGDAAPWVIPPAVAIGTQLIITAENCVIVGGTLLPLDTTALILAGAQTNTVWIMSALAVIGSVTIGALYITSKKN